MGSEYQYLAEVLEEEADVDDMGMKQRTLAIPNLMLLQQQQGAEVLNRQLAEIVWQSEVLSAPVSHDAHSEAHSTRSYEESDWLPSSPESSTTCDESTSSACDNGISDIFIKEESRYCKFNIESSIPLVPETLIVNPFQSSLPHLAPADALVGIKAEPSDDPDAMRQRATSNASSNHAGSKSASPTTFSAFVSYPQEDDADAQILEFVSGMGLGGGQVDRASSYAERLAPQPIPVMVSEAPLPPAESCAPTLGKRSRELQASAFLTNAPAVASVASTSSSALRGKMSESALDEITGMYFLMMYISTDLTANARGERDFEGLKRKIQEMGEVPKAVSACLNSSFKQKVKNLVQERRKRAQLDSWKQLREAPDIRAHLRMRLRDPAKFDPAFIETLAQYLEELLREDKKAPGDLLEWPSLQREAVISKAVFLHQTFYHNRLFDLYQDLGFLFALGELQLAILSKCSCAHCMDAWNLAQVDRSNHQALKLHWTRESAGLLGRLLNLHLELGSEMFHHVAQVEPKLRDWDPEHIRVLLKSLHTSTKCGICKLNKRAKHRSDRRRVDDDCTSKYHYHVYVDDEDTDESTDYDGTSDDEDDLEEKSELINLRHHHNKNAKSKVDNAIDEIEVSCRALEAMRIDRADYSEPISELFSGATSPWEIAQMYELD
ncbi:Hypothetical Protein FCC1311_094612 [Hondaea fermentalgiana]|uniref:Uncharacterized protein n=1 Tax=Hondaea fermentalgiana TaxID=2315210 RepID=A0A2R5GQT2_9STRA|nr:Hypothetical Protein FCC1311_094612 [Hondaea fermentalgiana]|eukprot:GBG33237.1 Hypothetical Protein FCC1311_094612 [Hondaea fermentalgiana]